MQHPIQNTAASRSAKNPTDRSLSPNHPLLGLLFSAVSLLVVLSSASTALAANSEWDLDPGSGDWNDPANWTPGVVPNGVDDTATFGISNTTVVSISANTEVDGITFDPGASAYRITATPGLTLTITGVGIVNNSGMTQNFVTAVDGTSNRGQIVFTNSASAGTSTIFTNNGSATSFEHSGETLFFNTSSAANGTFINEGATGTRGGTTLFYDSSTAGNANFTNRAGTGVSTSATVFYNSSTAANGFFTNEGGGSITGGTFREGGQTLFYNTSTAANGTFVNDGATASGAFGGDTVFDDSATAGNGIFTNNGGAASGVAARGGGTTFFFGTSTAANGTFTNNAAPASGAEGGLTVFRNESTADGATLIANGGINGGRGGAILFEDKSTGGTPRIEVFGNGYLDISAGSLLSPFTVGSIEGTGNIFLGSRNLKVGSNNMSTVFSGVTQNGGIGGGTDASLTKIGTGTLHLTGANTYTGNTNVNSGVLRVDGSITSDTFVYSSAKLAGTGTINGNLTLNNGTLLTDIGGVDPGEFSVLHVLGHVIVSDNKQGFLDPVLENGFIPSVGESFDFLEYADLTGEFFIHDPNIDGVEEHWEIDYQPTYATLTAVAGNVSVPDQGSTLLLLTLSLLALGASRRQLLRMRA